jgi:alkaline phosphatase D
VSDKHHDQRRQFLKTALASSAVVAGEVPAILRAQIAPAVITSEAQCPQRAHGLQIGDVLADRAIIWSRSDRASRMLVEYAFDEQFRDAIKIRGPYAIGMSDYTARVDLTRLPADKEVFVRVKFQDIDNERMASDWLTGRFRTAPRGRRDVKFLWSGDAAGQGWGINLDLGGMRIFETMRRENPDLFVHCGDTIYADAPIQAEVTLPNGEVWRNVTSEAKSKVAETLNEFRGNYLYNLLDENVRRFNAEVPQLWQWDDHEVVNNWSPSKDLSADARYSEKRVPLLVARATRAFLEYAPMRWYGQEEQDRIYRKIAYGRSLDVFMIDMRSCRGPNTFNRQIMPGPETVYLSRPQLEWLKQGLRTSRATWKVISSDMPLGLIVGDGKDAQGRDRFENGANGDGSPLGRELEIAELLRFIKQHKIDNVVWITADVHYTAAHYYDPAKAMFSDFEPFWEFVSGPLNAGSFGPNELDNTFGPQVAFQRVAPAPNTPPSAGYQFYGQVEINGRTGEMSVSLKDIDGDTLYAKVLHPKGHWDNDD